MAISVEDLVEQTRLKSGLRNNQLFTDGQIAGLLSQGYSSLRDKLIVGNFAHWFRATYDFSLTTDANSLDLSLVPMLEMVQGLDLLNGDVQPSTVPMLQSFANRNAGNGLWPLGVSWAFNGQMGRNYEINGSELIVRPAANATGDYRLIYTPMSDVLAVPTTPPPRSVSLNTGDVAATVGRWTFPAAGTFNSSDIGASFTVSGAANAGNNGTFVITAVATSQEVYTALTGLVTEVFGVAVAASIQPTAASTRTVTADPADNYIPTAHTWAITDANFTASDVGAVITASLDSPNNVLNGQYKIASIFSSTFVVVESTNANVTQAGVAGSFVIDRRQLNTLPELPQPLTPWSEYIVLYASILIRTSRQQQIQELELQLGQITARIVALTKQRSEGVRQAPITRGWGNIGGGGWGV